MTKDEDEDGHELDALHVLAKQMARDDRDNWPELLFCSATRSTSTRARRGRASGSAPGATQASRPARR